MKRILTSLVLVASVYSFAQVSISGEADDTPQATLDVKAIKGKTNGILVPRVTKEEADGMPIPQAGSIGESTLIYVTGDVSGTATKYAENVNTNGFYYFKDGKWVKLGGESGAMYVNWKLVKVSPEDYTITDTDSYLVFSKGGKVNLPDATSPINKNRRICVKNGTSITTAASLVVSPAPLGGPNGLTPTGSTCVVSDGENWYGLISR